MFPINNLLIKSDNKLIIYAFQRRLEKNSLSKKTTLTSWLCNVKVQESKEKKISFLYFLKLYFSSKFYLAIIKNYQSDYLRFSTTTILIIDRIKINSNQTTGSS